jgi:hypothetical protein
MFARCCLPILILQAHVAVFRFYNSNVTVQLIDGTPTTVRKHCPVEPPDMCMQGDAHLQQLQTNI